MHNLLLTKHNLILMRDYCCDCKQETTIFPVALKHNTCTVMLLCKMRKTKRPESNFSFYFLKWLKTHMADISNHIWFYVIMCSADVTRPMCPQLI